MTTDETPPTEETPETPPEPEPTPEPEQVAQEHHETMPEWAQALNAKVDAIGEAINTFIPDPTQQDETPARKPWHKRGGS